MTLDEYENLLHITLVICTLEEFAANDIVVAKAIAIPDARWFLFHFSRLRRDEVPLLPSCDLPEGKHLVFTDKNGDEVRIRTHNNHEQETIVYTHAGVFKAYKFVEGDEKHPVTLWDHAVLKLLQELPSETIVILWYDL